MNKSIRKQLEERGYHISHDSLICDYYESDEFAMIWIAESLNLGWYVNLSLNSIVTEEEQQKNLKEYEELKKIINK